MTSALETVLEKLLEHVEKPTRYTNGEHNAMHKSWDAAPVHMAFCFPDTYEIGMSHLGLAILYGLVNETTPYLLERVFAPWVDLEEELRRQRLPLFSLESRRPLAEFDVLGFTLQYEMSYTNILNMLDLGGVTLRARERSEEEPLVIAGGPGAFNPEPLADFVDCFLIGDAEELLPEFLQAVERVKGQRRRAARSALLQEVASLPGVYVPAFYRVDYLPGGAVQQVVPLRPPAARRVQKRVLANLEEAYFPTRPIVPFLETVHDRIMLEVLRGCTRGCRFCQAGVLYRPVRERSQDLLAKQARELVRNTGHDEISLTSLSTADYSCVTNLAHQLLQEHGPRGVGVSLPSLRVDAFSVDLAQEIQQVRRSGLTFAPEAGTQRMRDAINKGVNEENLLDAARAAFQAGWSSMKLYFMIGLPGEQEEDLRGIADLARQVVRLGQEHARGRKGVQVTVSASSFVPKPHTPFQWVPQDTVETLQKKQALLRSLLRGRSLQFRWHDPQLSFWEAVLARGSRLLGPALEEAWRRGAKFDTWSDYFRPHIWQEAFAAAGVDPAFYANRRIPGEETLPWEHIDTGVTKRYLWREYQRALSGAATPDCRMERCPGCGACPRLGVELDVKGGVREGAGRHRLR